MLARLLHCANIEHKKLHAETGILKKYGREVDDFKALDFGSRSRSRSRSRSGLNLVNNVCSICSGLVSIQMATPSGRNRLKMTKRFWKTKNVMNQEVVQDFRTTLYDELEAVKELVKENISACIVCASLVSFVIP